MMVVYTYSKARQHLSALLESASRDGQAVIHRKDGRRFVVRPLRPGRKRRSPLDVPGVPLGLKAEEIVRFIREGRRR
jgi:hypothetical protein